MIFEDWGSVEYEASSTQQLNYVDLVADQGAEERVVFCTHPPVVTLGRATVRAEDLDGWSGSLVETSRGGRATYHGPSQLVIYPIVDLRARGRDVHKYLRALESATVKALRELGLPAAEARTTPVGEVSLTGVWNGAKKIASVGIAVRKWITYHGVAVNVLNDPLAHKGIRPCGFAPEVMTSLEAELDRAVEMSAVKSVFQRVFAQSLSKSTSS